MTRRTKLIVLIALLILALLILAWLLWGLRKAVTPVAPVTQDTRTELPGATSLPPPVEEPSIEQQVRAQSSTMQSLAKTFVQRYGSYSTEANYANLEDVLPLMTERFAGETRRFIDTAKSPDAYYGVTTRVVSLKVDALDETNGTATLTLETQREEAQGSIQNTSVRYQSITLSLVRQGDTWLVERAEWK